MALQLVDAGLSLKAPLAMIARHLASYEDNVVSHQYLAIGHTDSYSMMPVRVLQKSVSVVTKH